MDESNQPSRQKYIFCKIPLDDVDIDWNDIFEYFQFNSNYINITSVPIINYF